MNTACEIRASMRSVFLSELNPGICDWRVIQVICISGEGSPPAENYRSTHDMQTASVCKYRDIKYKNVFKNYNKFVEPN